MRLTDLRVSFETYSTGGDRRWVRPDVPDLGRGFDHTESVYLDAQVRPTERVTGNVSVNVLGNVAQNPIDELYYERRARPVGISTQGAADPSAATTTVQQLDRVRIYRASLAWDETYFHLDGFYRTGH